MEPTATNETICYIHQDGLYLAIDEECPGGPHLVFTPLGNMKDVLQYRFRLLHFTDLKDYDRNAVMIQGNTSRGKCYLSAAEEDGQLVLKLKEPQNSDHCYFDKECLFYRNIAAASTSIFKPTKEPTLAVVRAQDDGDDNDGMCVELSSDLEDGWFKVFPSIMLTHNCPRKVRFSTVLSEKKVTTSCRKRQCRSMGGENSCQ